MKKEKKPKNNGYLQDIPVTAKGLINPKDARFYYIKSEDGHPRTTVCLGIAADGSTARGVAICSYSDTVDKLKGRQLAYIRMRTALDKWCKVKAKAKKENTDVARYNAGLIACTFRESVADLYASEADIDFKSEAPVQASKFEKGLLATLD